MSINDEKQKIINEDGNVLVTANPGTGKTRLLAYKYLNLIKNGYSAEDILCLTFTEKAKKEMESRILQALKKAEIKIDLSNLNVFTFHSYALNYIDESEILNSNLLRYAIFSYIRDHQMLNYGDDYLISKIVPKMENLMRYLKSFGIKPQDIDIEASKKYLEEGKNYSREEIDKFADDFLSIFKHYESIKSKKGVDYADLLIEFINLKNPPQFEYVLVDELQDVNKMEADIALKSAKKYFAVGDKKQAIFGFQGGSIVNFEKFSDAHQLVLSENFRSTNEILYYGRKYFCQKTEDDMHKSELKDLKSANDRSGKKPQIYDVERDKLFSTACDLLKSLDGKTAIITRTNYQIMELAKEMKDRDIDYSSTFFSASADAKDHIIAFLKGVFSQDVDDVKNAMFTPFFPCSLQDAFALTDRENLEIDHIFQKVPEFKNLRDSVKTVEDVNKLFQETIIPICVSYGREYMYAAISINTAYKDALHDLDNKNMHSIITYLKTTDLLTQESEIEKDVVLTTVHKAKGKQFDNVIYIPSQTRNRSNFQDRVVEGILKSKGINVDEELEEESLRINFVAFSRAIDNLIILTNKVQDYLNNFSELKEIKPTECSLGVFDESKKRAFDLFVNGQFKDAKKLLEGRDRWIFEYVKNYFLKLDHISFSSLPDNAYDYFVKKILSLQYITDATNLGSKVHKAAQKLVMGEEIEVDEDIRPYVRNVESLLAEIREKYPKNYESEKKTYVPLSSLGFGSDLKFLAIIDAVFRDGDNYLIVDWKTNKKKNSKHKQQLEAYRRTFCARQEIALQNVKVAVGYVGLRNTINTGNVECELDLKQPTKRAFGTFSKKVNRLLSWIDDPDLFFKDFISKDRNDMLFRSVVELYQREMGV